MSWYMNGILANICIYIYTTLITNQWDAPPSSCGHTYGGAPFGSCEFTRQVGAFTIPISLQFMVDIYIYTYRTTYYGFC